MTGPLAGLRVIEMLGLGPGPFAAMMLADMGAEVVRVQRRADTASAAQQVFPLLGSRYDVLGRSRRVITLDLKSPQDQATLLALSDKADALIEGYRPGVMEKLGLGPEVCLQRNPRLVYGRMTGWGQSGPLAHSAGHDINYLALSGMLQAMGRPDSPPAPPLNLVADFGGGGMLLAFGVVCALLEARQSGQGQVVDAAMTEGSALLGAMLYGFQAAGAWSLQRGSNLLDGAAHFYDTYACADQRYMAVGAIEPAFYQQLLQLAGIDASQLPAQFDRAGWAAAKQQLAKVFATKTQAQWCELLEGSDACCAPVLDMQNAPLHPHAKARSSFVELDGVVQPAPAPRFSRTQPDVPAQSAHQNDESAAILRDWGIA